MNEHPILFSGEMVRAILEGRKTQTRRVIKNWPPKIYLPKSVTGEWPISHRLRMCTGTYQPVSNPNGALSIKTGDKLFGIKPSEFEWICPYGQPGDRLWVRETFRWADKLVDGYARGAPYYIQYKADGRVANIDESAPIKPTIGFERDWSEGWSVDSKFGKWKPSIHMPRWASRINLEVVNIRVERVQDITLSDVCAEGHPSPVYDDEHASENFEWYSNLWDELNAKRGYGWEVNPWVWVIEFEAVEA